MKLYPLSIFLLVFLISFGVEARFTPQIQGLDRTGVAISADITFVCSSGQILKSSGSGKWDCGTDNSSAGGGNSVFVSEDGAGVFNNETNDMIMNYGLGFGWFGSGQNRTVSADVATTSSPGIVSFDNNVFDVTGEGNATIKANGIDDTHIDWGVGANQVSASDVPLADSGNYFASDNVEFGLQQFGTHQDSDGSDHTFIDQSVIGGASPTFDGTNFTGIDADDVDIADAGNKITATEVEGALQENRTAIDLNTSKVTSKWEVDGSETQLITADEIDMQTKKIINVVDPTLDQDAATKLYVDTAVGFTFDFFFTDTSDAIGGIYYVMTDDDLGNAESNLDTVIGSSGDNKPLVNFISIVGEPGVTQLESGIYQVHVHAQKTAGSSAVTGIYWELYKRETDTTETLLATSETSGAVSSEAELDIHLVVNSPITTTTTDRVLVKFYANLSGGSGATVRLIQEGDTASHFEFQTTSAILSNIFVRQDATKPMTADWDMGDFDMTMKGLTNDGAINWEDITALVIAADAIQSAGVNWASVAGSDLSLIGGSVNWDDITELEVPLGTVDRIGEIASGLKSGADVTLITGTATSGECGQFNGDGDLVGTGSACGSGGSGAFSDAGDPVVLNTTTKDVAIGAAQINSAKHSIDGDADQEQFVIQAHSTQTSDVTVQEKSDGTVVYKRDVDGVTTIGASGAGNMDLGTNTLTDDILGNLLKGSINLPVQSAKLTGTFITIGAGIDAGEGHWRLLFATDATEEVVYTGRMPNDYSSNPVLKIGYGMASATSGKVDPEVKINCTEDGDAVDLDSITFDTLNEITGGTTVPGTASYLDEISISLTNDDSCTAGQLYTIHVQRDHDDADDTAAGDMEIYYLQLEYDR